MRTCVAEENHARLRKVECPCGHALKLVLLQLFRALRSPPPPFCREWHGWVGCVITLVMGIRVVIPQAGMCTCQRPSPQLPLSSLFVSGARPVGHRMPSLQPLAQGQLRAFDARPRIASRIQARKTIGQACTRLQGSSGCRVSAKTCCQKEDLKNLYVNPELGAQFWRMVA